MKTFEVRSEEEGVGNLLLIVTTQDFTSDDRALKALWIEAQEYNGKTPLEVIELDYLKENKGFELKTVSTESFRSRLDAFFRAIESYDQHLEERPEKSLAHIKEQASKYSWAADSKILLLKDDFSIYCVFIADGSSKALFSWCDVV